MKIAISSCLAGIKTTYKGTHHRINSLPQEGIEWIEICPEVLGGLLIPRDPAEIISIDPLRIETINGQDVTQYYQKGAQKALDKLKSHNVRVALLKHKSPSCGCQGIYDGTFSHHLIEGTGLFAKMAIEQGIRVFHEEQIDQFLKYIGKEE